MVCVDHLLILDVPDGKMFVWEVHHGMLCCVECSSRVSAVSGVNVTPIAVFYYKQAAAIVQLTNLNV